MAQFFQLLRDRILNRAFIILQRHPIEPTEENQEDKSESDEAVSNDFNEGAQRVHLAIDVTTEVSSSTDTSEIKENTSDSLSHLLKKSCVERNAKPANTDCTSSSDSSKKFKVDIESFYSNLQSSNSLETRCESVLNLAVCLSQDSPDVEISDCLAVLKYLSDSFSYPHLAVCHSLLLCSFTRMSMSLAELGLLEERILSLAESLKNRDLVKRPEMYNVEVLSELHSEVVHTLCQELFSENYIDIDKVDISTICCSSLYNLSCIIKQHDSELGASYTFRNSTIKYVLGMTGKSTQEIVSENIESSFQMRSPSISSLRIKLCLQILEHALAVNPDLSYCESLHHESFSLPHCLTRLLGWSATYVFPAKCNSEDGDQNSNYYSKFYHSTLVCILKILSVLTFNPDMYDTFTNVKGLMEKILICVLKAYFESENNHFDIQVLCLEMLINLYIKNQKTFVLLCLKRFKINESEEVLAVEALIKMLSDNLEKIKEVKEASYTSVENNAENTPNENSVEEDPKPEVLKDDATDEKPTNKDDKTLEKEPTSNSEEVLQAASKDMEHSTIVSFICVLIVFFMRTKQNFKEFILERLTSDALKEATTVSRKFLEFASLTGGMPVTGILILSQTINKLQAMQSS